MELYFFRHGETKGNSEKRYVGTTDEDITEKAVFELKKIKATKAEAVYSSPLKRCVHTAEILFPGIKIKTVDGIRETDFGDFEYKNYDELKNEPNYQKWLDSGGKGGFPNGETYDGFKMRCKEAFLRIISDMTKNGISSAAVVTHGGVIMALFEECADGGFYDYQIKNGQSIYAEFENDRFYNIKRNDYD